MELLVIIVNYKTANHVIKNLETLVPELRALDAKAKCWIVDNNSPDDSVEVLEKAITHLKYDDVVNLIPHTINGGFGAGNNVAIKKTLEGDEKPDYFYLLNPDAVISSDALENLLTHIKNNSTTGVVGGPIFNMDGTYNCGAFRFPGYLATVEESISMGPVSKMLRNYRVAISPPPNQKAKVDWVSGASMMVSRSAIEKAGLFDEGFFLYFEEVDLCKRITENGFDIYYIPDARIMHVGGVATGVEQTGAHLPEYWHHSRRRYYKKHFGFIGLFIHNLLTLGFGAIGYLYKKLRGRHDIRPHYLRDIIKYNFFHNND